MLLSVLLCMLVLALCVPLSAGSEPSATGSGEPLPAVEGRITIAPDVAATTVATGADPSDREERAADDLADYLAQISGKRLARAELTPDQVKPGVLAVGRLARDAGLITQQELDSVAMDGYVVRVVQGRVGISGWRDVGAAYGVYALLGKLGVKFYARRCEIVPSLPDLRIPECEMKAKPAYEWRGLNGNLKLGQSPRDDMGDPGEIGERGNWVHSADFLVPYDKYSEEHPEYFALQKDGTRLRRDPKRHRFDVHLCLSNPDVRRISAERLLYLIEQQPDRVFFGVSQGDGSKWCECENCKALDGVPGVEMTDRLLDYVNYIAREVAKKHPDKRILTLAYTFATSPPPRRVLPEPNVMVQFCPYPHQVNCQSHDFSCEQNQEGFAHLKGWIEKCPENMYIFDYPRGYQNYFEPFGSFYAMKSKLDFYAANGIRGIYYCGLPSTFHDLFVFVNSRLLWQPDADVEALIDEFMPAYYGPAAPAMREYFDYFHAQFAERNIHQMCEGPNPGVITPEVSRNGLALFAKAEAAAAGDETILRRIWSDKFCLLFADLNERNLENGLIADSEDEFAHRLAEFCRIARLMRRSRNIARYDSTAADVPDWLFRIARLHIEADPWHSDPLVDRLIAHPPATFRDERQKYAQRAVEGGLEIRLVSFYGGATPRLYFHGCEPKKATWVYGGNGDRSRMKALFLVEQAPPAQATLSLEGQDDEGEGSTRVRIAINGATVFGGANEFAQLGWSRRDFAVPAGTLRQGENEIEITNLEAQAGRWFMISECKLLF